MTDVDVLLQKVKKVESLISSSSPGDLIRAWIVSDIVNLLLEVTKELETRIKGSPIIIWPFDKAPEELQNLSTNGGDEDWLALVPTSLLEENFISWLEVPHFGCSSVDRFKLPNGFTVVIGCHA